MVETEVCLLRFRKGLKVTARGFQQNIGAYDIGPDEFSRAVNGTVDMGFGGQVHHMRRVKFGKHTIQFLSVADVHLFKTEAGR